MLFLDTCATLWPLINLIKNGLIPLIQIVIPIILIILGMLDLGKAVIAGKEDEMKKAQGTLIKRAVYALAVFLVVTLVIFIMGLLPVGGEDEVDNTTWRDCWTKHKGNN